MSLTVSTKSYTLDRSQPDAISYKGPAHTLSIKDLIELKRVYPKPVKGFAGVARPTIKVVKTVLLADGVTHADAIVNVTGSFPVGMSDADVGLMVDDVKSLMTLESAGTTHVMDQLALNY